MIFITLPFGKKGPSAPPACPPPAGPPKTPPSQKLPSAEVVAKELAALRNELDDAAMQLEICKIVVERYRKFIEDGEAKSIAELRSLVKPLDHTVVEIKINIQDAFHPYVYDKHFVPAVQKALDVIFSYRSVTLPVNFWLEFDEIQRLNASDDIDKAILLCSLLRSLGSETARVLITKNKDAMVVFEFGQKQYVVEISRKAMCAYPEGDDAFLQIKHMALYSFNDLEYEDLSEG